jgi:hypothetical protein
MKLKFTKMFSVVIRGKRWRVYYKAPPGKENLDSIGLCDYEARKIYIRPGAKLPDTLIHEAIHAAMPDACEYAVEAAEEAVMLCLYKSGLLIDPKHLVGDEKPRRKKAA